MFHSKAYIMLLTFFLHGGMVTTKTVTAYSSADCEGALPFILRDEQSKPLTLAGVDYRIDYLDGRCVEVRKKFV